MASSNIDEIKIDLAETCRILANEGLVDAFGHGSVRIEGTDRFLISPYMSPALVQPDDIITMNLANEKLEGEKSPNSETWIHSCIYRKRPHVIAVLHIHPFMVRVLTIAGQTVLPTDRINFRFNGIPTFTNPESIRSEELGIELADTLGSHRAVLQRGHGAVIVGNNLRAVCMDALYLESAAKMQVWASMLGPLQVLSEEELKRLETKSWDRDSAMRNKLTQRAWEYYTAKLHGKLD